jgi:hypothetical protein
MLLSARVLKNLTTVNSFEHDETVQWMEGDSLTLHIQLLDAELDTDHEGFYPPGRRYMPVATSTLTVVLENVDDARKVTRVATQPYATLDPSIWAVTILATDLVRGAPQIRLTLVEPSRTIRGVVKGAIRIQSASNVC